MVYKDNFFYINAASGNPLEECPDYYNIGVYFVKIDSTGNLKKEQQYFSCNKDIYLSYYSNFINLYDLFFSCGVTNYYDEAMTATYLACLNEQFDTLYFIDIVKDTIAKKAINICKSHNNNIIMCGQIDSTFNPMNGFPETYYVKTFLMELSLDGNILWQKTYSFDSDLSDGCLSSFTQILPTYDKGYIMTGLVDEDNIMKKMIVKTDSIGNIEWYRKLGKPPMFSDIINTQDSCYIVFGAYSNGEIGGGYYPYDAYILKYDNDGNFKWLKKHRDSITSGITSNDYYGYYQCATELENGNILAICSTKSNKNGEYIGRKFRLRMLDSNGNRKWDKVYTSIGDGEGYFYANSIIQTNDNKIAISGWGEFNYYDSIEGWTEDERIFLIKTDTTNIDTIYSMSMQYNPKPIKEFSINCYPNPAKYETYIEISDILNEEILVIYTTKGQIIHEQYVQKGKNKIDVSNLKPGMYLLRLKNINKYGKLVIK